MRRYLIFFLIALFTLTFSGCGMQKIQKRHSRHSKRYTKHVVKRRMKQRKMMKRRKSIHRMSRNNKTIRIKKFGGTYIIR
jgi:hypothetical protein